MEVNRIILGDCLEVLKTLPDNSVDCCVTSPPYYALRDYGTSTWEGGDPNCQHQTKGISNNRNFIDKNGRGGNCSAIGGKVCLKCGAVRVDKQLGLENTPEEYIAKMTEVFMEVYRVLKPEGTLWLNIGDSYNGNKIDNTETIKHKKVSDSNDFHKKLRRGAKPKDLIGIPWMLAFSLRNAGWYLRQDIIWHKPNPMPESVTDRCTKAHEYIFLFSKSYKYYFDYEAIQEPCTDQHRTNFQSDSRSNGINKDRNDNDLGERSKNWKPKTKNCQYDGQRPNSMRLRREAGLSDETYIVRNKRDVWSVNVKPCKEAHFATYPTELIRPCILAGCPKGGVVLDCFMGAGTTAIVAKSLDRNYLGIELNPEYKEIAEKRLYNTFGMFL